MNSMTRKIFVLVEGARTDASLMQRLFRIYNLDVRYEIVSYCTNIHALYNAIFIENDPESIDLLQLLKSHEPDEEKKEIFNFAYSDILLVFDLDPQDKDFFPDRVQRMAEYFTESSDMGKLYLNYPMIEAFYHMKSIPDQEYNNRYATLEELKAGTYKKRVGKENRDHDYKKFAVTKQECNTVIKQNICKARQLTGKLATSSEVPSQQSILLSQLSLIEKFKQIAVLSTCAFFIPEYNPTFID